MRTSTRRFVAPLLVALALAASGLPAAPSAARAAGTVTALAIDSEPGDSIGQGQQLEYEPPAAGLFSIATFDPGWTFVQVLGAQGGDFWNISLRAAGTGTLAVGTYDKRAADLRRHTPGGLDIAGQGRGCNMSSGRFVIGELKRDMAGNVTTLAASFEQHCEGGSCRALRRDPLLGDRGLQAPRRFVRPFGRPRVGGGRIRNAYPEGST